MFLSSVMRQSVTSTIFVRGLDEPINLVRAVMNLPVEDKR